MTKKKTKICFISVCAYGLFNKKATVNFGGAEVQMYQLAKEINRGENFEVSFIANFSKKIKFEVFDGIKVFIVYPLFENIKIIKGIFGRILFILRLFSADADVYIHRAAGIETGIICFFCKIFGKKFIYMTASLMDIDGKYVKENGIRGKIYEYGLKNASQVLVQSKDHKKFLKEKYGKESIIVNNSFPIPLFNKNETRDFILWVGSSQKLKHPEIFSELAKNFPEEKFVIIMPKLDKILWNVIKNKSEEISNLELIEKVPLEEIGKYYQKAKIFINTSDFEGFPNTFVQAAMFGTPIVSLNVNPDNFINIYNCGYVAEGDKEKMKEQIKNLLENQEDWKSKSNNSYKYAKNNHNININRIKLIEIINDVLKY